ncbi:heat shock protein 90 HSP90, putative [Theileria equi strain WA]|uniref:Heat shock protein 90 HSP90, putative n=1 Tax=Theileria equi strain WA TaxID=1537102 RepID=L0B077_THEEQ|nr:heat shock protein 90 HSP90, putative [Theileria equi strain WA]AFZ81262.1 heat shock protein 90 HSP90, putative [Theileria equi strain WA]|eukprot:XP_004830928.1 heat shock protein 90 HSP90, putative [Theileria equi strain WA]
MESLALFVPSTNKRTTSTIIRLVIYSYLFVLLKCKPCSPWRGHIPLSSQFPRTGKAFIHPSAGESHNIPKNRRNFKFNALEDANDNVSDLKNVLQDRVGLSSEASKLDSAKVSKFEDSELKYETVKVESPKISVSGEVSYPFQAEVSRVMDIIVNSLYTDRDIFLRELVSNSADALDKRRIKADPDEKIAKEAFGGIRIIPNKVANTLTIEDDGIGMTVEELKKNLGTIAESGTAKFLQQYEAGKSSSNLIGQFGVGFYSAFLVANTVEVYSRAYGLETGPVHRWKSDTTGTFSVAQVADDSINKSFMPCGTRIVLHLKPECDDYLEDYKLKELLRKYSEFVRFPIQVWVEKVEYERVPDETTAVEGKPGRYKTVTKKRNEWEVVNTQMPIWRRSQDDIRPEDYVSFYKSTFKAYDDPLSYIHFKVEGQVEFSCLLFVPGSLPWELSRNMFDEQSRGIRLYVKRVFINDKFTEAIPRWLTFIRGVVDSDELSLNVGREYLQKSKALTVINKRISTKAVDMLKNLKASSPERFKKFTDNFGKYIKIGIVEDRDNQQELASLTSFYSSHGGNDRVSLDEYIERMKPNQPAIYYVTADSIQSAKNLPSLEKLKALDYEVLFSLEPLDEFCLASIAASKYKNIMVVDVNKSDLKLQEPTEEEQSKEGEKKNPLEFETLCGWLKGLFHDRLHDVKVSTRLVESPALLVQTDFGLSPSMQKYMKQQATSAGMDETELFGTSMVSKPVLEINIDHPIIQHLNEMVKKDKLGDAPRDMAKQLLDVVSIQGGYTIEDPSLFAKNVLNLMQREASKYFSEEAAKS